MNKLPPLPPERRPVGTALLIIFVFSILFWIAVGLVLVYLWPWN